MAYPIRTFDYATIVNTVDGDTCDIEVDLGFSVKIKQRFRLIGIDTPERGQPGFAEATAFLRSFEERPVRLEVVKLDKYGRYLVTLWADSVNVNEAMLERGLATVYV